MITETYTCDKCGNPMTDSSYGMYRISHETITGSGMWGDNRIPRTFDFCLDCFEKHIVPILPTK